MAAACPCAQLCHGQLPPAPLHHQSSASFVLPNSYLAHPGALISSSHPSAPIKGHHGRSSAFHHCQSPCRSTASLHHRTPPSSSPSRASPPPPSPSSGPRVHPRSLSSR